MTIWPFRTIRRLVAHFLLHCLGKFLGFSLIAHAIHIMNRHGVGVVLADGGHAIRFARLRRALDCLLIFHEVGM